MDTAMEESLRQRKAVAKDGTGAPKRPGSGPAGPSPAKSIGIPKNPFKEVASSSKRMLLSLLRDKELPIWVDKPKFDTDYFLIRTIVFLFASVFCVGIPYLVGRLADSKSTMGKTAYGGAVLVVLALYYVDEYIAYARTLYMFTNHRVVTARQSMGGAWSIEESNYYRIAGISSDAEPNAPGSIYYTVVVGDCDPPYSAKNRHTVTSRVIAYIPFANQRVRLMRELIARRKLGRRLERARLLPPDILEPSMRLRLYGDDLSSDDDQQQQQRRRAEEKEEEGGKRSLAGPVLEGGKKDVRNGQVDVGRSPRDTHAQDVVDSEEVTVGCVRTSTSADSKQGKTD